VSAVSLADAPSAPSRILALVRATGPAGMLAVAALAAVFGPLLASYGPNLPNLSLAWVGPVGGHLLGYDFEGRDVLSRLLAGAQTAMLGPLMVVAISVPLSAFEAPAAQCAFAPRCAHARDICRTAMPGLTELDGGASRCARVHELRGHRQAASDA
jgi:ABC-type microcin C transport system permease subunit YejE